MYAKEIKERKNKKTYRINTEKLFLGIIVVE